MLKSIHFVSSVLRNLHFIKIRYVLFAKPINQLYYTSALF